MKVTPDIYRAAADRLYTLAGADPTDDDLTARFDWDAITDDALYWATELTGAAEALEHHLAVTPNGPEECERCSAITQTADDLAGAVWDALGRLREPTPGLDDLDRVLADLEAASRAYIAERDN